MRPPQTSGPIVAIDGPAGTGKSSAAKRLAEALQFIHVDTGAIYRAVGLLVLEAGEKAGTAAFSKRAGDVACSAKFEFRRDPAANPKMRILVSGRDVSESIRTPAVSMAASQVSAVPEVRAALLGLQRQLGGHGRSILEGRDIGTVVFPHADVKFFLTATPEERAKRRLAELEIAGSDSPSFEEVKQQILARDHADSTRAIAPLRRAPDAIEVDTSTLTLDEVVSRMEGIVRRKTEEWKPHPS